MSSPIAWVLKNKPVLLVGGGEVAETRVRKLVPEQAQVVVVAPSLTPYIQELATQNKIRWIERGFKKSDLDMEHWSFVLTAIDDHDLSKEIAHMCRSRHIPVNVADVIPLCDFYFGANFQQGPSKVMVSTGSGAPRLAKRVLNELAQHAAKFQFGDAITNVSKVRAVLREHLPENDPKTIETRMSLMKTFCDKLTFAELAAIKPEEIKPMIRGMISSTAACPAHPIGELDNAEDFVDAPNPEAEQPIERKADPKAKTSKADSSDNNNSSSSSSDTSSESDDSDSESGESSEDSDESMDEGIETKGTNNEKNGEGESSFLGSMKRKAVECAEGYPKPKLPSFPFSRP